MTKKFTREQAFKFLEDGASVAYPCTFCGRVVLAGVCCTDMLRLSKELLRNKFDHMSKDDAPHGPCGMCENCRQSKSLGERQCVNGWPMYGRPLSVMMVDNVRMRELLQRLSKWESLTKSDEGAYWAREIETVIDEDSNTEYD